MRLRTQTEMGARIAQLRGEMTKADLADALGIDRSAMSRIESGQRSMNLAELMTVSALFGVNPEEIIYDDQPLFAMRSDADPEAVRAAIEACTKVIRDHRLFRVVAGSA